MNTEKCYNTIQLVRHFRGKVHPMYKFCIRRNFTVRQRVHTVNISPFRVLGLRAGEFQVPVRIEKYMQPLFEHNFFS